MKTTFKTCLAAIVLSASTQALSITKEMASGNYAEKGAPETTRETLRPTYSLCNALSDAELGDDAILRAFFQGLEHIASDDVRYHTFNNGLIGVPISHNRGNDEDAE